MSKIFTVAEVAKHNKPNDIWIIVSGKVLNITSFLNEHPGGKGILLTVAGKDATVQFNSLHKPSTLTAYLPKLQVGVIATSTSTATATTTSTTTPTTTTSTSTAAVVASKEKQTGVSRTVFGEGIPYGDPSWYQDWNSPYYKDSHRKFRAAMREFVEANITPNAHAWDEAKAMPRSIWKQCGDANWLAGAAGAPWRTEYAGDKLLAGISPQEFDPFTELILIDEVARAGSGGVLWGLFAGLSIGLPPVLNFGSKPLKDKVCRACLKGEKIICLAITEPYAGSDVANLQCKATKTPDGKHFIVNGEKKWITNGVWADYFTVAVRTGGEGMAGLSLLLIEREFKGVSTKQMQCSGVWSSGTSYITFEDVKVPVENLIGQENQGFKYIMLNFNHERWQICVQAIRFARVCLEDAMRYSFKRKTFGKRLIEHPVIRFKLAQMARQVEASQSWLESITYQLTTMSHAEQGKRLGGPIALLKAQATQTFEFCAREAAQIFGGLSYTRGGQGERVERLYREVRAYAIPGGSEEIMLDLGIRQSVKDSGVAKL